MENYFLNFSILNYEGFAATNIMARPYIRQIFKDNHSIFYNYKVPQGHRPDKVAHDLYGKSEYVWIIYLFNDILDPFYDWPLSEESLRESIIDRYDTVENSMRTILYYRNNWYNDTTRLDRSGYDALTDTLKKFWKPQVYGRQIIDYERKQVDTIKTTNQILTFDISLSNSSVVFTAGEFANQGSSGSQVAFSNSSTLVLKHIVGSFSNSSVVVGANSGANATITSSIVTQNVVSTEETSYYSPIYAYDKIIEDNENKSYIRLVRSEYVPFLEEKLKEALST